MFQYIFGLKIKGHEINETNLALVWREIEGNQALGYSPEKECLKSVDH